MKIIRGEPEQAPNTRVTYSEFAVCMYVCIYCANCSNLGAWPTTARLARIVPHDLRHAPETTTVLCLALKSI